MTETYCIDPNYRHNLNNHYFDDTPFKDEYQDEVYSYTKNILTGDIPLTVLDIGCGSGFKLLKYFDNENYKIIGSDLPPTVSWLKNNYPNHIWIESENLINYIQENNIGKIDMVICSDVIEHIPDCTSFMNNVVAAIDFNSIVISTPNREKMYEGYPEYIMGPPVNLAHVREWTGEEFKNYINSLGFIDIKDQQFIGNTQIIYGEKL